LIGRGLKNQQRKLAGRVIRANAQGMPRMDAVEYLISALEAYRQLALDGQKSCWQRWWP
jgi:hypothetical protein